jgi:hypothetical protein
MEIWIKMTRLGVGGDLWALFVAYGGIPGTITEKYVRAEIFNPERLNLSLTCCL